MSDDSRNTDALWRVRLTRRQALAAAGTLAVGQILLRHVATPPNALARVADGARPRISVGYVAPDGPLAAGLPFAARPTVLPGAALASGDAALRGRDLVVRVLGLVGEPRDADAAGGLDVDALLLHPDPTVAEPLPFYVWTRRSGARATSERTRFRVRGEREPTLGFTLRAGARRDPAPPATAVFTTGDDAGLVRLRRGFYLLGTQPGAWDRRRRLPPPDASDWAALASVVVSVDGA